MVGRTSGDWVCVLDHKPHAASAPSRVSITSATTVSTGEGRGVIMLWQGKDGRARAGI